MIMAKVGDLKEFSYSWDIDTISIFINDSEIHLGVDELAPYTDKVRSLANTLLNMCQEIEIEGKV